MARKTWNGSGGTSRPAWSPGPAPGGPSWRSGRWTKTTAPTRWKWSGAAWVRSASAISPNDATAAYNNAIAWTVSGDEAYAKKAIEILNAWAGTCKTVNGKDAVLCAGIYGYKLVNAAEIIRSTYKKWPEQEIEQFKRMMQTAFYPVIQDFSPFANGNWDTACLPTVMSLGIFLDDRAMFDRAVAYFMDGAGDGTLTHYIVNEAGQCQESGRDQGHTQVGIGHLASACEIGWHQGLDMYGFANRRLLQGFEYTAQYNLGGAVPFEVNYDRTGKYNFPALSALSRYRLAPLYEMVYHHYQNRMGIAAPFTAQAAARRPEGSSIDLPGNGTLLFTLPPFAPAAAPTAPPASPGPIVAKGSVKAITLAWVAARAAESYTVQRSERSGGPYEVIAQDIRTTTHTDAGVAPGRVYHYVVSAANAAGAGPQTLETAAGAGLPVPWRQQDVGGATPRGETLFDGRIFTLEGAREQYRRRRRPVSVRPHPFGRRWRADRALRAAGQFPVFLFRLDDACVADQRLGPRGPVADASFGRADERGNPRLVCAPADAERGGGGHFHNGFQRQPGRPVRHLGAPDGCLLDEAGARGRHLHGVDFRGWQALDDGGARDAGASAPARNRAGRLLAPGAGDDAGGVR